MGRTHAVSGAAVLLATQPALDHLAPSITPHGPVGIATAAVVCAGAALLPDLDHPSSTIARAFGPVTELLARLVAGMSGGHRHATHSLLFAAAAGSAGYLTGRAGVWWAWPVLVLLAGLGMAAVGATRTPAAVAAAVAATTPAVVTGTNLGWLGPVVALGVLAHLAGDCLTGNGCPLLWPAAHRFVLRLVDTGGRFEQLLLAPALIALVGLQTAHLAGLWR